MGVLFVKTIKFTKMRFFSFNVVALSVFLFMSEVHGLRLSHPDVRDRLLSASSDREYSIKEIFRQGFVSKEVTYSGWRKQQFSGTWRKQQERGERVIRLECYDEEAKEVFEFSADCEKPVFTISHSARRNNGVTQRRSINKIIKMVSLRGVQSSVIRQKNKNKFKIFVSSIWDESSFTFLISQPPSTAAVVYRYVLDIVHAYSLHMNHSIDYVRPLEYFSQTVFAQETLNGLRAKEYLEDTLNYVDAEFRLYANAKGLTVRERELLGSTCFFGLTVRDREDARERGRVVFRKLVSEENYFTV